MQPKPQKKRAEKRVHNSDPEEECSQQDQRVTKKKRGKTQFTPTGTQNPTRTPTAVTVNPAPPSHLQNLTYHSTPPVPFAVQPITTPYATQQYYATPQGPQPYNPYTFMRYAYTTPPFYGYFQTPMRPVVPTVPNTPYGTSQNEQASSSSADQI
jgi:hypothetical protein